MSLALGVIRGAFWVAGASTRLGVSAVVLSASAIVTATRVLRAIDDVAAVVGTFAALARGARIISSHGPKSSSGYRCP